MAGQRQPIELVLAKGSFEVRHEVFLHDAPTPEPEVVEELTE